MGETKASRIADFYRGKSVFMTGGTGFIGKTLIEKLLYSCPEIDKIYLLVRDLKGANFAKRFEDIFEDPLFTRLKTERPECLSKVVPVLGELSLECLLTSEKDRKMLIEKVSVVFHVAATIRFNEPLKLAMSINVEGTQKVLQLCRQMKNLEAVVHVSTAFIHPMEQSLEEKFYPFPMKAEEVNLKLNAEDFSQEDEEEILADWPNSYVFTKSLTESIIAESYTDIPLVIVRPSIVTAMKDAPLPGWIDNWAGAAAMLYPIGKGFDRVIFGKPEFLIDLIPVDYVSNCIISTATTAKRHNIAIFNICTSSCNPINLKTLGNTFLDHAVKNGYNDFYYPFVIFTESPFIEQAIMTVIKLFAFLADVTFKARNLSPRYLRAHSKVIAVHDVLRFFTSRTWMMKCDAARSHYQSLDPADRELFPCDPRNIHWKKYIASYCDGIEEYLVKKMKRIK